MVQFELFGVQAAKVHGCFQVPCRCLLVAGAPSPIGDVGREEPWIIVGV